MDTYPFLDNNQANYEVYQAIQTEYGEDIFSEGEMVLAREMYYRHAVYPVHSWLHDVYTISSSSIKITVSTLELLLFFQKFEVKNFSTQP